MIAGLHRLTEKGSRSWLFAGFVAVVAIASQALVHGRLLQPQPAIAGGYAASAAIGLMNSRGLSVRSEEAWGAKRADRDFDLLELYQPDAPRVIVLHPISGLIRVAWIR